MIFVILPNSGNFTKQSGRTGISDGLPFTGGNVVFLELRLEMRELVKLVLLKLVLLVMLEIILELRLLVVRLLVVQLFKL